MKVPPAILVLVLAVGGCSMLEPIAPSRAQPVPRDTIRIDGWDGLGQGALAIDPNASVILLGVDAAGSRVPTRVPVELLLALLEAREVPLQFSLPGYAYVVVETGGSPSSRSS
ncbi:MAG: hypothetical protein AB1627_00410 [Chloroflexota bacterium]